MSNAENRGSKFFLCCFCGRKIASNRYNLDLHERRHGKYLLKIQCAAKNCRASLCDKRVYWDHWVRYHSDMIMPDFLNYCHVLNDEKLRKSRSASSQNAVQTRAAKKTRSVTNNNVRATQGNRKIDDEDDEIVMCDEPKNSQIINIKDAIERCLLCDPFYGQLSGSHHV